MNIIHFPITAQILIPSSNRVSIRLMIIKAEYMTDIITPHPVQTIIINGASVEIHKIEQTKKNPTRSGFNILVDAGKHVELAFDVNFMGQRFEVDGVEGYNKPLCGEEICWDLHKNTKLKFSVWLETCFLNRNPLSVV